MLSVHELNRIRRLAQRRLRVVLAQRRIAAALRAEPPSAESPRRTDDASAQPAPQH